VHYLAMASTYDWQQKLLFLAIQLDRKGIRGSTRATRLLQKFVRPVKYSLGRDISVLFPLSRTAWGPLDIENYEAAFVRYYSSAISSMDGPVTHLDIGADIGLFTLKVLAQCSNIEVVRAFEPGHEACDWLRRNLAALAIPAEATEAAVSNFRGRGVLRTPPGGDHAACFLDPDPSGQIDVCRIDDLGIRAARLAMKIDVEGGEMNVLLGAESTIRAASRFVIGLEAHPDVLSRTGIDTSECLRLLRDWGGRAFLAAENGITLDADTPVFSVLPRDRVFNVLAVK